jgi:hypothetical protein
MRKIEKNREKELENMSDSDSDSTTRQGAVHEGQVLFWTYLRFRINNTESKYSRYFEMKK